MTKKISKFRELNDQIEQNDIKFRELNELIEPNDRIVREQFDQYVQNGIV